MTNTEKVSLTQWLAFEEGQIDEDGGTVGWRDWPDVVALGTMPPEDPVAFAEECEAMGR